MTLRLFRHNNHSVLTSFDASSQFDHFFGGTFNERAIRVSTSRKSFSWLQRLFTKYLGTSPSFGRLDLPRCHLLYCLDLRDSRLGISLPNSTRMPLIYGFNYVSIGGTFRYRILNEGTIEVLTHNIQDFRDTFPRVGFPRSFPIRQISFEEQPVDVTIAEQALLYQGVFGIEDLSEIEMARAVEIAKREELISFEEFRQDVDNDWSDASILGANGRQPFMQVPPSCRCENPLCTVPLDEELTEIFKQPIRLKSNNVIALYEPSRNDNVNLDWQILFQFCDYCKLVSVRNQCD